MSDHKYWRHRWSPQHVTTVDMTGTMNAPQWEPVHVLNDAELAALVTPTREQIAQLLYKTCWGDMVSWDYDSEMFYDQADAVLALMQDRTKGD